ncbi:MAG: Glucose-phosphate thymidylyltransferase [Parcubacteria group bacterium]|nr:Glucose-phosphate thymidylyltransferase [Parcubacteria group bacterium]
MKGVILAGGSGTRLQPVTLATNKHLFPVYDKPVIYYAIEKLFAAGIDKIMIVTSGEHIGDFVKLLGSGQHFKRPQGGQVQIVYAIQNEPNGVAYGLYIAKEYVGTEDCALFLGDNIFEDEIESHIKSFSGGARVFLKKVPDPERFGVATVDSSGKVTAIEEKPMKPASDLAVTGLYLYDATVFDKMLDQQKSARGEYEITYLNNKYIAEGTLDAVMLEKEWFDVGTFDSLLDAGEYMRTKKRKSKQ